jgi:hypothetical protein
MTNHELALRIALAALIKVIKKLCDENCKKAYRIPEYNQAQRLLDEPL